MIYNILDGGTGRIDPICHVIRAEAPDVVLLCEATDHMQTMTIARKLGMAVFPAQLPHNPLAAVALLSQWDIAEAINWGAINPMEGQPALSATVRQSDRDVVIAGLHLTAGRGASDDTRQLEKIISSAASTKPRPAGMLILLGDLAKEDNQTRYTTSGDAKDGPTAITAPLPPMKAAENNTLVFLKQSGWIDAQVAEPNVNSPTPNFPTHRPVSRVDRIFVKNTPHLRIENYSVIQNPLARFASDHYPIVADVTL